MIVTLTANPSIDRTVTLTSPLERGSVHRAAAAVSDPGGKGVNVARVVTAAGVPAIALLPGSADDPLFTSLNDHNIDYRRVDVASPARINLTISEPDGTTTKINEPGAVLSTESRRHLADRLRQLAGGQTAWVVLAGSLPPGVPDNWYAELCRTLAHLPVRIAVDTSEEPLLALARGLSMSTPNLLKPNSEELAQLTGASAKDIESAAAQGDPTLAVQLCRTLVEQGVETVLATLGAAGAVLVDGTGAWYAQSPPMIPRSTVGAGDSSLAGYLLAQIEGAAPAQCLQRAVAYGCAAAALPGTALPTPADVDIASVVVTPVAVPAQHAPVIA